MNVHRNIVVEFELENLRNEVAVLHRNVESKVAAINILRSELEECQRERNKFKAMTEQKTILSSVPPKRFQTEKIRPAFVSGTEDTLAQLLSRSKEESKALQLEIIDLKCKLHDAQSDLKVLRSWKVKNSDLKYSQSNITSQLAQQEREEIIQQLEVLSARCKSLESDMRDLLEEREELLNAKDCMGHKLHRLNYVLNKLLSSQENKLCSGSPSLIIDLDAVIMENRYFHQRLKQSEDEKALLKATIAKYKTALDKNYSHRTFRPGFGDKLVLSHKQVGDLMKEYKDEINTSSHNELKSLCIALTDSLNQRSSAVKSYQAANKVLAERIKELERRVQAVAMSRGADADVPRAENAELLISQSLMHGYVAPTGNIPLVNDDVLDGTVLEKLLIESHMTKGFSSPLSGTHAPEEEITAPCASTGVDMKCRDNSVCNVDTTSSLTKQVSDCSSSVTAVALSADLAATMQTEKQLDSFEEIPIDQLDGCVEYVKNSQMKANYCPVADDMILELSDPVSDKLDVSSEVPADSSRAIEDSDSELSYKFEVSDYDSDDNQLEQTLKEWQTECNRAGVATLKNMSPKKVKTKQDSSLKKLLGLSTKDKDSAVPEGLQEIFE